MLFPPHLRLLLRSVNMICLFFIVSSVISADIWHVSQMKWNWLDSHWVINQAISRPDFWTYNEYETLGRDFSGYSLFYQTSHRIYGVDSEYGALWQYVVNYAIHALIIIGTSVLLLQHIPSRVSALFSLLLITLQSSGPEVYLSHIKNEHFGTLWIILICIITTYGYRFGNHISFLKHFLIAVSVLACTAFSIGFLGKEPFIVFVIAVLLSRLVIPLLTKQSIIRVTPVDKYILSMVAGSLIYFAYRTITGVKLPFEGSYSSMLLSASFLDSIYTFQLYLFHSIDIILLILVAHFLLIYAYFTYQSVPGFDVSSLYICHTCALFSSLYVVFYVFFIRYAGPYYLYPAAVTSIISMAVLLESPMLSELRKSRVLRLLFLCFLTILLLFTLSRWLSRSIAMVSVTQSVNHISLIISRTPANTRILLHPFKRSDDRVGGLHILMTHIYQRNDIIFQSLDASDPVTPCDSVWLLTTGTAPTSRRFGFGVRDLNGWSDNTSKADVTLISRDHNWTLTRLDFGNSQQSVPLYLYPAWDLQPSGMTRSWTTLLATSITLEWDFYKVTPNMIGNTGLITCANAR